MIQNKTKLTDSSEMKFRNLDVIKFTSSRMQKYFNFMYIRKFIYM
jgi:hypothetical protein